MKNMLSKHISMHLALMAIVLGGVFGLRAQPTEARFDAEAPLLVSTRTAYRYCVTTSAALAAQSNTAQQQVAQSLAIVGAHPGWARAYGYVQPQPETCPSLANLPTTRLDPGRLWSIGPGTTTNPGPWRTVVVVLDEETANIVLGKEINSALVPYEIMKQSEHVFATATQAVLVRESHVSDPLFISRDLTIAAGLEPIQKPLPPAGEKPTK